MSSVKETVLPNYISPPILLLGGNVKIYLFPKSRQDTVAHIDTMCCTNARVHLAEPEIVKQNANINRQIHIAKKTLDRTVKILLLGMILCVSRGE